jgi:hypothetical protein
LMKVVREQERSTRLWIGYRSISEGLKVIEEVHAELR